MTRFYGEIGYAGVAVESAPGVWTNVITEVKYRGDVVRNSRRLEPGVGLNNDLEVDNSISIVADAYANNNFHTMRYIRWAGALWTIANVEVQSPRLLLRLGNLYNGPVYVAPVMGP